MYIYHGFVPIYNWVIHIYLDISLEVSEVKQLQMELCEQSVSGELIESILSEVKSNDGNTLHNSESQVIYLIVGKLSDLKRTLNLLKHESQHIIDIIADKHGLEREAKGYLAGFFSDMFYDNGLYKYIYEKFPNPFQTRKGM